MNSNRFIIVGVALSVLMSAASLAWQAKRASEKSPFAALEKPLQISELDYRLLKAEFYALRPFVPLNKGIEPPEQIRLLRPEMKTIGILISLEPAQLPSNFDERKRLFTEVAQNSAVWAAVAMGIQSKFFEVRFSDPQKLIAAMNKDPGMDTDTSMAGVVAVYKDGKLTMRWVLAKNVK
jgi:hypothetical protein